MSAIVRFCVHPLTRSSRGVGGRGSLGATAPGSGSAARSAVVRGAWRCGAHGGPTELGAALAAHLSKPGGRTTAGDLAADFRDSLTPPGRFLSPLTPIPAPQLQYDEAVDDRSVDWRYEVLAASAQPSQPVRVRVLAKQQQQQTEAQPDSEHRGSVTRRSIDAWDSDSQVTSPAAAAAAAASGPEVQDRVAFEGDVPAFEEAVEDRLAYEGDVPAFEEAVEEAARGVGALAPRAGSAGQVSSSSPALPLAAAGSAGVTVAAFTASSMDFIELD